MANNQNLKPFEKGCRTNEEAVEIGRKGGINSGKARRRKADLRKIAQSVLDGTFTDKNGKEFTGEGAVLNSILANIANPDSRNWGKAMDLLIQLTNANKSKEELKAAKAQAAILQAKLDMLTSADTTALDKLDGLLKEMRDHANTESETE